MDFREIQKISPLQARNTKSDSESDDSTTGNTEEERDFLADESEGLLYRNNPTYSGDSTLPVSQICTIIADSQSYGTMNEESNKLSISTSMRRIETPQSDQINFNQLQLNNVSVQRFWLIFTVVLITFFIACFDSTIMVSSHPVITSYFKSSNKASWLSTAFLLTSTGFQPLFGGLSDTIGRKRPYIFSLTVFSIGTVWCGLAQSMTSFIFARAFCGLGAGGMVTLSAIVTSDLVPIEIRGIYQSYINVAYGVGSATGAAFGGWIADSLGWRWEFGIQIPTLLLCLCVAYIAIPSHLGYPEGTGKKNFMGALKGFDYKGSILLTSSTTFLILGLDLGGNIYAWGHPIVIMSFVIFIIFFPLLLYVESHSSNPIMPPKIIFKNPRASLILISVAGSMVATAVMFNVPLFFQAVMLDSATNSGLRLLLPSILSSISGALVGLFITWTKKLKTYLVIGMTVSMAGSVGLSFLHKGWQEWVYVLFIIPNSLGQGFMYPTIFMAILAVSHQSEQAIVTTNLLLWRSLGQVFGVSFSSLILQNMLRFFLDRNVNGSDRQQVIEAVRKSITAIHKLNPYYQKQVIESYAEALRFTFACTAILSIFCVILCAFIKLPRLGTSQKP